MQCESLVSHEGCNLRQIIESVHYLLHHDITVVMVAILRGRNTTFPSQDGNWKICTLYYLWGY